MTGEFNEAHPLIKAQQELRTMKAEARLRRIEYTLKDIKRNIADSVVSRVAHKIQNFLADGGGNYLSFGDISDRTSIMGAYDHKSTLAAFGISDQTNLETVPIPNSDAHVIQTLSSKGAHLSITNNLGVKLDEALLHKASERAQSTPHTLWLKEFSEVPSNELDSFEVAGHTESFNDQSLLELAILISAVDKNQVVESIFEALALQIKSELTKIDVATSYNGLTFSLNFKDGFVTPSLKIDKNQMAENGNKPHFSDSNTFATIVMSFSSVGLQLTERLQASLFESEDIYSYNSRYGNGYADFSRKVSEQIGKSADDIVSNLFRNETPVSAKEKISKLPNLSIDSPAGLIFSILKDLFADRVNQDDEYYLDLDASMKDGSCSDAEINYVAARQIEISKGESKFADNGDFILKKFNVKTALLKHKKTFFGVTFPPGYLFMVTGNKIRPLRPTMACFNEELTKDAFGWQYEKAMNSTSASRITDRIRVVFEPYVEDPGT